MKIKNIRAIEVFDSRGNPTVMAEVMLDCGARGQAMVPSGASTGAHEAVELRDNDMDRLNGKGVKIAVNNIETVIKDALIGRDASDQKKIDSVMLSLDGTENKANLGANAILAVSIANLRAAANCSGMPLWRYMGGVMKGRMPLPMMNIINGGAHADNSLDIQEFMIMPVGAKSFKQGMRMCVETYHALKKGLKRAGKSTAVGDEGGFAPDFKNEVEAIDFIINAVNTTGYKYNEDIRLSIDAAATEWFKGGKYRMPKSGRDFTGNDLCTYWRDLASEYSIASIEDAAAEDDMETWRDLTKIAKGKFQLVGDDLFVTNPKRLEYGIKEKIANAILIKPNQIGTVTETLETIVMAKQNLYATVISHRSGETGDTFIADLAVATDAGQIKTGAPCRSERCEKYNRLLCIENDFF